MNKKFLALICFFLFSLNYSSAQDVVVDVNPHTQYQKVEGWGSSLCWWAHMIGQWEDEDKIDEIVDWITSSEGLNMNVFRYNIPGGDDPSHYSTDTKPGHMASGKGVRAEMEGFKPSEDSPYDWNADAGQRKIMLKIKERRSDAVFEAFSNSPPYWMTYSGCSSGNTNSSQDNLKPEYYDAFCDYLIDICKHYKETYGIEFKTLEPFNEPLTSYWGALGGQEGCHFGASSQISLIKKLYPKLKASGLNTVISASDETCVGSFLTAMNAYIADKEAVEMIGQINTHSYSGSVAEKKSALEISQRMGKTLWQSETGPMGLSGSGLTSNIFLAQRLIEDMRFMRPDAWIDWQLMEEYNDTWCQIRGSFADETYYRVKNYYVRMQFSRFIKQGYKIIKTNSENTLAAISPQNDEIVLCFVNTSENTKSFAFDLSRFDEVGAQAVVYTTNTSANSQKLSDAIISNKQLNISTEANSVTTAIISANFTSKKTDVIFNEINFEDSLLNRFESKTSTLSIENNGVKSGLNGSSLMLSAQLTDGGSIIYKPETSFTTSESYRYLHVMTRTDNLSETANNTANAIILNATDAWTDQVFDLQVGTTIDSLLFESVNKQGTLYIDNIHINSNPEARTITENTPVIDFDSEEYKNTIIFHQGDIEPNTDKTGLNPLGNSLAYTIKSDPNSTSTENTVTLKLSYPLKLTADTRYLHLMIKYTSPKVSISTLDLTTNRNIISNTWTGIVIDLEPKLNEVVHEIKIAGVTDPLLSSKLWIDNIYFNDNPNKAVYTSYETPESDIPYIVVSRNSENILSQNGTNLIQTAYDPDNVSDKVLWMLTKENDNYSLSNKATGDILTDTGGYFAELNNAPASGSEKSFSIEQSSDFYSKVTSMLTTKSLDVESESTASGARVGFWAFSNKNNQQWSFVKYQPGVIPKTQEEKSLDTKALYIIKSRNSNNILQQDNTSLIQATYKTDNISENQLWVFEDKDGLYAISNKSTGEYIYDDGSAYHVSMTVNATEADGLTYTVSYITDEFIKIISSRTTKLLDVEGGRQTNGTKIGFWKDENKYSQQWQLIKYDSESGIDEIINQSTNILTVICSKNELQLISLDTKGLSYEVYSINGALAQQGLLESFENKNISLAQGIYIVKASTSEGKKQYIKAIVY